MGCESLTVECLWKTWCHNANIPPQNLSLILHVVFKTSCNDPHTGSFPNSCQTQSLPGKNSPAYHGSGRQPHFDATLRQIGAVKALTVMRVNMCIMQIQQKKKKKKLKSRQTAAKQFFYIQTHLQIWWHEIALFDDTLLSCFLLCSWWVVIIFCLSGFDKWTFLQRRSEGL